MLFRQELPKIKELEHFPQFGKKSGNALSAAESRCGIRCGALVRPRLPEAKREPFRVRRHAQRLGIGPIGVLQPDERIRLENFDDRAAGGARAYILGHQQAAPVSGRDAHRRRTFSLPSENEPWQGFGTPDILPSVT